ncbi:MAG: GNAT family N-acetyltransferase [Thermoplasmatales archaeon]|nr:GNAT family N-acetyltransferase [Thermoplasmatales archaeon]
MNEYVEMHGKHVILEPVDGKHTDALVDVSLNTDFTWMSKPLFTREDIVDYIEHAIAGSKNDSSYAFAVRLIHSNEIVGITGYLTVNRIHRRFEIGGTWFHRKVWGTVVNPETKFLLLQHAFEDWGASRVQFVTDENNVHSANAIEKLGAKYEGTLRNHKIRLNGLPRNSKIFSIVDTEWPTIRESLKKRIDTFPQ